MAKGKRPARVRGHFELIVPRNVRVTGFGAWAKEHEETDFRIPHKDPRRRPPVHEPQRDPPEERR